MPNLPPILILAGGEGTRLQSVVSDVPKPLAEVAGKPFLQWHLDYLHSRGLNQFVISTGFKSQCFGDFIKNQTPSISVEIVVEKERLGTGGAVVYALEHSSLLQNHRHFFCLNGDSFSEWSPSDLLINADEQGSAMIGLKVENPSRYGTVFCSDNRRLLSFDEKSENPRSDLINGGIYCFHKAFFAGKKIQKNSLEYDFFPEWIKQDEKITVVVSNAKFIDIGTPESYQAAQSFFDSIL